MARRKHETQLQQEIETTEEWEELMAKEGLFVIDVYQEWCGPCNALVTNFRRLKNEIGDDLLRFAVAKADTIEALEKYRGRCEPCFLFFAGGVLVAVIHGARTPEIQRTITEQLKQEHKVQEGNAERKEVRDPVIAEMEEEEQKQMEEHRKEDDEVKGFTVALIKPDAVQSGKVDEIIEQMEEAGIEILAKEERHLTEDEAREFYSHLEDEDYFEDLIKFMSSGPSFALVLTKGGKGENVLQEWREMLGPPTVEKAKEEAPESLRAKYGNSSYMNALHGSDSPERAARELAFFFPNMSRPTVSSDKPQKTQRTLALIRPDAFRKHKDEIMDKIKESGFRVALQKEMTLTKEQAEEFYKEHRDKPYFEELTTRMSNGPLLALGLAREDAVKGWRDMLGPAEVEVAKEQAPDSLRAMFADDLPINPIHGSDSEETAEQELRYFFPMEQTVAVIKPDAIGTKEDIVSKIHEAGFRIAARKETQITREIAEEFYSEHKDKEYFDDLVEHMISGPTMFMVLSREDAVHGWREAIGPTDPELAKAEAPESLRAQFGENILKNAVHGSSNPDHAKDTITKVFGPLEFNPDGTVKVGTVEQEASMLARKQAEEDSYTTVGGDEIKGEEETQEAEQEQTQEEETQESQQEQTTGEEGPETEKDKTEGEETKETEEQQQADTAGEEQTQEQTQEQSVDQPQAVEETKTQDTAVEQTEGEQQQDTSVEQTTEGTTDAQAEQTESKDTQEQPESQQGSDEKPKSQPPSQSGSQQGSQAGLQSVSQTEPKEEEKKEEEKKEDEKKEDDKKEDDKKEEEKKEDDKKEDDKKEDDKKEDGQKEDDKKEDEKSDDKKGESAEGTKPGQ